jgi:NCS1 family nucleobase:cation symporter-1
MCLGAALAAWAGDKFDTVGSIQASADRVFHGFGGIVLVFAMLGLVSVTALNMYGGSLTLISAADSFRSIRPTSTVRIVTIAITAVLSLVPALLIGADFLTNFEDFLLLVLYLFVPWTAVNLVDYYVVRRGHYAIAEIFNPHGMYGRWGWRGIISYLVGFGAMLPFLSTSKYTGFVATALNGADISFFVGLPVAGLLYWVLARTIDVRAETAVAEREAAELETLAAAHDRPQE